MLSLKLANVILDQASGSFHATEFYIRQKALTKTKATHVFMYVFQVKSLNITIPFITQVILANLHCLTQA